MVFFLFVKVLKENVKKDLTLYSIWHIIKTVEGGMKNEKKKIKEMGKSIYYYNIIII